MNCALIGNGRMGQAIGAIAAGRGHRVVATFDRRAAEAGTGAGALAAGAGAEVAFEFSAPDCAARHVVELLEAGVAVVCGTTGWEAGEDAERVRRAVAGSPAGLIVAPNFSVGMQLFFRVVRQAAAVLSRVGLYEPWVHEMHHRGKRDLPSGTARRLAGIVTGEDPRFDAVWEGALEGRLPDGRVHVTGTRAGHEPGTHTVGYDGEHDAITLVHRARGRTGFALGAVLAGEWLMGRRGRHEFAQVLDDLGGAGQSGRGGRR